MYKYYEKNGYNVMYYEFDSIHEFIDYLDKTPINTNIWNTEELSSMKGDYSFCQTNSLEEAENLCKYGQHGSFDRLVDLKLKLEKYIKLNNNKQKQYNYYVGYTPDVKAYLEGNPLTMLNKETPRRKEIDIYYNAAILGCVSTNEIFNRGAITLSIVEILESLGYSVGLNIFTMSKEWNQIHYAKFNLKKNGERLNIQKLFFPLCNPSFLRRLVFRLREVTPDIIRDWTVGYGSTCNDYIIRKIIDLKEDDIVICQPSEMGINGYSILSDAEAMFNYLNRVNIKLLEEENVKILTKDMN